MQKNGGKIGRQKNNILIKNEERAMEYLYDMEWYWLGYGHFSDD